MCFHKVVVIWSTSSFYIHAANYKWIYCTERLSNWLIDLKASLCFLGTKLCFTTLKEPTSFLCGQQVLIENYAVFIDMLFKA